MYKNWTVVVLRGFYFWRLFSPLIEWHTLCTDHIYKAHNYILSGLKCNTLGTLILASKKFHIFEFIR